MYKSETSESPEAEPPSRCQQIKSQFNATEQQWNDWRWQLSNSVCDFSSLREFLGDISDVSTPLPLRITPYYLALMAGNDALSKTVVASSSELIKSTGEFEDPLGEHGQEAAPGLIHRYPDRVLLLATDTCASYCRYCTRSRLVGKGNGCSYSKSRIEKCLDYISEHTEIRDVLISGGDPLTLSDNALEWILQRVKDIPHVEMIRIGTKVPVVLPQRITPELCQMLKRYHPLWMSIHFTHPNEITPEVTKACADLANAGIPLGSQTVLLKDVNDSVQVMKSLMTKLLKIRVRPYYVYALDPIFGSSHFKVPVQTGIDIIEGLRGHISGYGVPTFVVDAPGGGGKIPIYPNYVNGITEDGITLRNYENKVFFYPDKRNV